MDISAPRFSDDLVTLPATELRESLENILTAIGASAYSCSEESRALEMQRQRVLALLSKLDIGNAPCDLPRTTAPGRGTLLSPVTSEAPDKHTGPLHMSSSSGEVADIRSNAAGDDMLATFAEAGDARTAFVPHPDHRCLLANLFSKPRRHDVTAPLNSALPCILSPPSRPTLGKGGLDGQDENDSVPYATAALPQEMGQLCCSPAVLLSLSQDGRELVCEGHDLPSSVPQRCRVEEDTPQSQQSQCCALSAQVNAHRRLRWYSDATDPRSFWINVWPCYGGSAASRCRHPTRVLVRGRYRYFEDVLEAAANLTDCKPASQAFYTPDGCPIRHIEDLIAEHHYLLFPFCGFYRKQSVPTALLWLLYTDARHLVHCS
ncbi:conserved hypothetical protein [Leishmania major strain Friedlin]|uniref:Uncharacterized protein n=1 Tax=Leishmania major TaxID=5664 RepID=Q4Q5D2_LEIMA|nr:conserved hypothetical protein [Leishmania major strain Friedlin]CAG9580231.1 hypothetical_protein_-_conserved [Leishmania major strain Friedlin]CAJ08670.1 conserved hypothetical protein [Leishmania major strain Friedlin]|eukprot:XP_001685466.1 conserved hypothetical protein [Leishmania major strain Friedlin]